MAGKQVSRDWVRRYERPRDGSGRFAAGTRLYVRWDGEPRWLRHSFDPVDPEVARAAWLNDEGRRVLTHLVLLVVVAFLVIWAWPL